MILQVLLLYVPAAVALLATAATFRRRDDPDVSPRDILALWPFAAIALVEALQLRANGHMVHQWLVPAIVASFALSSRSPVVVRRTRRAMILVAFLLWVHGVFLLADRYATRPLASFPGLTAEPAWFTPWTGFRRLEPVDSIAGFARPHRAP